MGATGTYVQKWEQTSKGISLDMESDELGKNKKVLMFTLAAPCAKTTTHLIKIGSTKKEVLSKYANGINDEFSNNEQVVIGSIYGGVIFTFEDNLVKRICVGAVAE